MRAALLLAAVALLLLAESCDPPHAFAQAPTATATPTPITPVVSTPKRTFGCEVRRIFPMARPR